MTQPPDHRPDQPDRPDPTPPPPPAPGPPSAPPEQPPPAYQPPAYQPSAYQPPTYSGDPQQEGAGYSSSYGQPAAGAPAHPQANLAMVLGIVGVALGLTCGVGFFVSPFALIIGRRVMREVDSSGGQLSGRGQGQAGFVLGIIGSALLALGLVALVLLIILGVSLGGGPGGFGGY